VSQSGDDPIGDFVDRVKKNPLEAVADVALQYQSLGTVGYENGKFKRGVTVQAVDEGLGEITGRNVAREQINAQKDAINEQKSLLAEQRRKELLDRQNKDIQASNQAAGLRQRNPQLDRASVNNDILGDNKDYLGL